MANDNNNKKSIASRTIDTAKGAAKIAAGDVVGGAVDVTKGVGDIVIKVSLASILAMILIPVLIVTTVSSVFLGGANGITEYLGKKWEEWQLQKAVSAVEDAYSDVAKDTANDILDKVQTDYIENFKKHSKEFWKNGGKEAISTDDYSFAIGKSGDDAIGEYISTSGDGSGVVVFKDPFATSTKMDMVTFLTAFDLKYQEDLAPHNSAGNAETNNYDSSDTTTTEGLHKSNDTADTLSKSSIQNMKGYQLPTAYYQGTSRKITDEERKYIENVVQGEVGGQGLDAQMCEAQLILDRCNSSSYSNDIIKVITAGWEGNKKTPHTQFYGFDPSFSNSPCSSVQRAVSNVFDNGIRMTTYPLYYNCTGTHQNYKNAKCFDGETFYNDGQTDDLSNGKAPTNAVKTEDDDSGWTNDEVKELKKFLKENKQQLFTVSYTEQTSYKVAMTTVISDSKGNSYTSETNENVNAIVVRINCNTFNSDDDVCKMFFPKAEGEDKKNKLKYIKQSATVNNANLSAAADNDKNFKKQYKTLKSYAISPAPEVYEELFQNTIEETPASIPVLQFGGGDSASSTDLSSYKAMNYTNFTSLPGETTGYLCSPIHPNYSHSQFISNDIRGYPTTLYRSSGAWHGGTDIPVAVGTPIYAMDGGVVTYSQTGWNYGMGTYVEVKCQKNGYVYNFRYQHLSKRAVSVGTQVKQGQLIAFSGNSGSSTGPHLHVTMYKGYDASNGNRRCICDYVGLNRTYIGC